VASELLLLHILVLTLLFSQFPSNFVCSYFVPSCFAVLATQNGTVCGGHGVCIDTDICECDTGWAGNQCEVQKFTCHGVVSTSPNVCAGHGLCVNDSCQCIGFLISKNPEVGCGTDYLVAALVYGLPGGAGAIVACVVLVCCAVCLSLCIVLICKKVGRMGKDKGFEVRLNDVPMDADQVAKLDLNSALYKIKWSDIALLEMLGKGGGGAVVYKAVRISVFSC